MGAICHVAPCPAGITRFVSVICATPVCRSPLYGLRRPAHFVTIVHSREVWCRRCTWRGSCDQEDGSPMFGMACSDPRGTHGSCPHSHKYGLNWLFLI